MKTIHPINADVAKHLAFVSDLMKQCNESSFKIKPFISNATKIRLLEYPVNQISDEFLLSIHGLGPAVLREIREYVSNGASTIKVKKYFKLRDPNYKPYNDVFEIADTLKMCLDEGLQHHYRVDICGSLRRESPYCRDIDIITTAPALEVCRIFEECDFDVLYGKDKKIRFNAFGIGVDVRCISDENKYAFFLLHCTGSKTHNIILRQKAISKGWKLSENGLCDYNGRDMLESPINEEEIFNMLGVEYIPPKFR